MDSPQSPSTVHKHACASCARRKIRCDRQQPCSNCVSQARMSARRSKHRDGAKGPVELGLEVDCVYVEPAPVQRHRRKLARATSSAIADDLLDRLRLYEDLLSKNGISLPDALARKDTDRQQHALPRPTSHESGEDDDERLLVDDHTWIASPWEAKMAIHKGPAPASTAQTPSSGTETLVVSATATECADTLPVVVHEDAADAELDLWQSMPPELRNPPVSSVFARRFFGQKSSADRATDDAALNQEHGTMPVAYGIFGTTSPVPVQHPEPRMILHLWQTFIDNVNPVMRIVHVPTTHQQIVDASWDAANAPPATGALMFAIYTLALTSMTVAEYTAMFASTKTGPASQRVQPPPPKRQLLTQYRRGAMQCLVAAGILTTKSIDVLRAFTLLILAETDSELSSTLASMAVHLGLKMGLHRESQRSYNGLSPGVGGGSSSSASNTPGLSFFEREMGVRLWWQIRGIDARMRQAVSLSYTNSLSNIGNSSGNFFGSGALPPFDADDLRLPLNVNDADLHPAMTCAPVEHSGPTEMLYVRVKYHTALWMRAFAQKKFASGQNSAINSTSTPAGHLYRTQTLPAMKNRAIDELEQMYHDICHRYADPRIPLHAVSSSMARMAVAQLRFQAYHPRMSAAQPPVATSEDGLGSVYSAPAFSRHNADATFRHALSILEMCFECRQVASIGNSFAVFQLLADVVMRVVVDAAVYVACMLRARTGCGDEKEEASIASAWRMMELFYKEYGQDLATAVADYEHHILSLDAEQPAANTSSDDEAAEEVKKLAAGATFVIALSDLTLEAWAAREQALRLSGTGPESIPDFIAELQAKRAAQNTSPDLPLASVSGWGDLLFQEDSSMDWEYWNNFLQM